MISFITQDILSEHYKLQEEAYFQWAQLKVLFRDHGKILSHKIHMMLITFLLIIIIS